MSIFRKSRNEPSFAQQQAIAAAQKAQTNKLKAQTANTKTGFKAVLETISQMVKPPEKKPTMTKPSLRPPQS